METGLGRCGSDGGSLAGRLAGVGLFWALEAERDILVTEAGRLPSPGQGGFWVPIPHHPHLTQTAFHNVGEAGRKLHRHCYYCYGPADTEPSPD